MAENVSIITISSTEDEEILKVLKTLEDDESSKPTTVTEAAKTPVEGGTPLKSSKPRPFTVSPLKILDLSWVSQGDKSIEYDNSSVIVPSSKLEMENMDFTATSPRQTVLRRTNYLMAVRAGLQITMTQMAVELANIEIELDSIREELRQQLFEHSN